MDSTPDRTSNVEQELQEQLLSGVQNIVKQGGRIRDQLRDLFEPYDYVTVLNPFEHTTGWAYVDPADEQVERPDKTTRRVQHGKPKTRIVKPGEQVVIHGWEAYIAIERMFKEYAQTKGKAMSVVLSSQLEMDAFIAKSFGGVFDPSKMNQMMNATNAPAVAQAIQQEEAAKPAPVPASDPLGFEPAPVTQNSSENMSGSDLQPIASAPATQSEKPAGDVTDLRDDQSDEENNSENA